MVISFNKNLGITDIYIPQSEFQSHHWLAVRREGTISER